MSELLGLCACGWVVRGPTCAKCGRAVEQELPELLVLRLAKELVEVRLYAFYAHAYYLPAGKYAGWWETQPGTEHDLADALVKAGVFEQHAEGRNKVQFYRPVERA